MAMAFETRGSGAVFASELKPAMAAFKGALETTRTANAAARLQDAALAADDRASLARASHHAIPLPVT